MSKRRRRNRQTWKRNSKGNVIYRFGETWYEHYRTVKTKTERDKIVKKLRANGWRVRTKITKFKTYIIARRKK